MTMFLVLSRSRC